MRSSATRASTVQTAPPRPARPVNSTVTGWGGQEPLERQLGRISEETGLHAEPHLLSASVLSASGSHRPLLSLLVFRSTVSPPPLPPLASPSQSLSHLLPLL